MATHNTAGNERKQSLSVAFANLSADLVVKSLLMLVLVLQFSVIFTRSINWDEFWFYHLIALFTRGELTMPLQTFHVRLFAWLTRIDGSGIDHIVIARLFMFACELVTIGSIVAIGRRFVEPPVAMLAGLLYVSAGFVFQHGFSFRTDPMATAALMASLAMLARRQMDVVTIVCVGVLIAVAAMITTKVILYLPAFAGIAWLNFARAEHQFSYIWRNALLAILTAILFASLYLWHTSTLLESSTTGRAVAPSTGSGASMLAGAASWMFFIGVPPYINMIYKAMLTAPLLTLFAFAAPFAIVWSKRPIAEKVAIAGFWSIIFVPLFYKNTAGYFYVFMFAPLAIGCTDALRVASGRYGSQVFAIFLAGIALGVFIMEKRDVIDRQRSVQEIANEMFPEPVAYFDHNGMLPGFAKANYLMTPSGMSAYREAGIPTYRNAMLERPVPLLLANWFSLQMTLLDDDDSLLLPPDLKALRENYVPFHGPIWLAGKNIPSHRSVRTELLVPGEYTVLDAPVVVDGKRLEPGEVIELERGIYTFFAPGAASRIVWGRDRKVPAIPWNQGPLYVGF